MPTNDRPPATWGNWYWPVYLTVAFLFFIAPEIMGLVSGRRNTLSDWVWTRLHIIAGETIGQWSALDFLVFGQWIIMWAWLTWHFFFHRFT